ncbi:MAG: hypothetical protein NT010_01265 [Proteobacteria bacterium]|nr:hypothetical protein [Pseudomonadota bacterium]
MMMQLKIKNDECKIENPEIHFTLYACPCLARAPRFTFYYREAM